MSVQPTLQIGHPALYATNQKVSKIKDSKIQKIVQDLIDTMRAEGLIGMAAPQIGRNYQIFVTEPRETKTRPADQTDELRVYINPKIIHTSTEKNIIYEGCGSVLKGQLFGPIARPRQITVEATDHHGKKFQLTADGILGRVIQHEYDHVHGKLFLEYVTDSKDLLAFEHYQSKIKDNAEHQKACLITVKEYKTV